MTKIIRNQLGLDLHGQNFSGQDGDSVLFRGANLSGCNFSGTSLRYANMRECNIEGANFTGADLTGSNFKDCLGTAIFKDALIAFAPKHIDFIGAYDAPNIVNVAKRQLLIDKLFSQANVNIYDLSEDDEPIISEFIQWGHVGSITGDYGTMPEGEMVYDALNLDHSITGFSVVVDAHINGGTYYDESINEYVKG